MSELRDQSNEKEIGVTAAPAVAGQASAILKRIPTETRARHSK
jgi:hypothetical protein